MTAFDAKTVVLSGTNLIEASAGTGKTYTLAELYLRLVLEQNLTVDKILVVTYTRAATEELRDRLRQKLVDARDALLETQSTNKRDFHKLNLAIQSFDQAAIFTIHGFCQRVLTDFAFESGLRFDVDLIGDELEILQSATDDFWRREVSQSDPELSAFLLAKKETPETLLQSIRSLIGKPYLNYIALPEIDFQRFQQTVTDNFNAVKTIWAVEQDQIIATLQNKTLLNGNKYRTNSVEAWLVQLMAMMESSVAPATLFENFERFTKARLEDALKKDQQLPELDFWLACQVLLDAQQQLETARTIQLQNLRLSLLAYLNETVPTLKQQQQVQSYDDLLVTLEQALNAAQGGDQLVEKLRSQYQAALIDEFQDTDPVQYQSFSRIYADSGLPTFYVGDPKQAIYSFRGADIFTYLKAKAATEHEHTLGTNWRSHPYLVSAVNSLFERKLQAFFYEEIPFISVQAARPETPVLLINNEAVSPLSIVWTAGEKTLAKKDMTNLAANSTADEIARLLNLAQDNKAELLSNETQPLSGGDIAVLVRNHRQAAEIQYCLQQRGINSVQQGRENVFASHEALLLERLLLAVAEPNNASRIIAVLASPLFGLTAFDLYDVQQDEPTWLKHLDFFHELHQLWLQKGFMSMFRHVMVAQLVQQRVLALNNGERQLTNLYHLAELIQDYCSRQKSAIGAVLHWLASHRKSASGDDETAQLRLESDEQLVKIITIHKSKGLEYPIVFCPFLWDVNLRSGKDEIVRFHDPEQDNAAYVAMIEPSLTQAKELVLQEEKAEDLRLLYVALTRARERCIITWGNANGVNDSALFSLLHPTLTKIDPVQMAADLQELASSSNQTIVVEPLIEQAMVGLQNNLAEQPLLAARDFVGKIDKPWRIGSFSALTAGHDAEMPDYDSLSPHQIQLDTVRLTQAEIADRFKFPKGAQAGTCLHSILEQWDFKTDDNEGMSKLVSQLLVQYGFDQTWTEAVCKWLCEIVITPLSAESSLCLADLTPAQRLDEMAFYFPVTHLSVSSLKHQLKPYLVKNSALEQVINRSDFYDLSGFMKGFIDLIFEHEGRFYVVDYKSNFLGSQPQDYTMNALDEAMISHDYPLQYLIYSLALHRYLALRLPDYDPAQHLGGVYYLFIRGMHPDWGQAGVFADRPSVELLTAFDHYLQGLSNE
jgi:exodeoxyribonuclease V beta subunit